MCHKRFFAVFRVCGALHHGFVDIQVFVPFYFPMKALYINNDVRGIRAAFVLLSTLRVYAVFFFDVIGYFTFANFPFLLLFIFAPDLF